MISFLWYRALAFLLARYELIRAPDGSPYLSRWHFPACMAKRYGARYLFLHKFHQSDPDRGWHNHPWEWCESRILKGVYVQEILFDEGVWPYAFGYSDGAATWGPGDVNALRDEFHSVRLLTPVVWTLFRAGPKHGRSWGFKDQDGNFTQANS